jgi:aryl-alcohol dehydrogenase-like predicted oxidoreductase
MRKLSLPNTSHKLISEIGAGVMPFSRPGCPGIDTAVEVLHHCLNSGITLLNTADVYAPSPNEMGHNENVVREVLNQWDGNRDSVIVVTKNGILRNGNQWSRNGSKEYLLRAAEASVAKLGFVPDLILHHRIDRNRPFAEQAKAMAAVHQAGLAQKIGFSNVTAAEYDIAQQETDGIIAAIENERSPRFRDHTDVLERCQRDQIAFLAWSPLGGENDAKNLGELHPAFQQVANELDVTAQQVALRWLRHHSEVMVPIPGFTKIATATASIASMELEFSAEQLELLDMSPAGDGSVYPD